MSFEALSTIHDGPLFAILTLVLFGAAELGFKLARRGHERVNDHGRAQASTLQGATLGLLALIMGFTFAIAVARFDARRLLVVAEANAIGTAYLRTSVAPPAPRVALRRLLRDYADMRLRFFSGVLQPETYAALARESKAAHDALWSEVNAVMAQDPHSVAAALLMQAINEVVDRHGDRMAAREAHIPSVVIVLLVLVACISIAWVGYSHGLGIERRSRGGLVLSALVAASLVLILDLDRPRRGLVRVTQEPMRLLTEDLRADQP